MNANAKLADVVSINSAKGKPSRKRAKALPKTAAGLDIVSQVRVACAPEHRLATILGGLLGCFVPLATFVVAHLEISAAKAIYLQPIAILVLGGLVYSARTVYCWGKMAFGSGLKALGFTVLIEGVMTCSGVAWLSYAALGYLIAINGIATGVTLALPKKVDDVRA